VSTLPQLIEMAQEQGVKIVACTMSMDVLGIQAEELIDGIDFGGAARYMDEACESRINLFSSDAQKTCTMRWFYGKTRKTVGYGRLPSLSTGCLRRGKDKSSEGNLLREWSPGCPHPIQPSAKRSPHGSAQ